MIEFGDRVRISFGSRISLYKRRSISTEDLGRKLDFTTDTYYELNILPHERKDYTTYLSDFLKHNPEIKKVIVRSPITYSTLANLFKCHISELVLAGEWDIGSKYELPLNPNNQIEKLCLERLDGIRPRILSAFMSRYHPCFLNISPPSPFLSDRPDLLCVLYGLIFSNLTPRTKLLTLQNPPWCIAEQLSTYIVSDCPLIYLSIEKHFSEPNHRNVGVHTEEVFFQTLFSSIIQSHNNGNNYIRSLNIFTPLSPESCSHILPLLELGVLDFLGFWQFNTQILDCLRGKNFLKHILVHRISNHQYFLDSIYSHKLETLRISEGVLSGDNVDLYTKYIWDHPWLKNIQLTLDFSNTHRAERFSECLYNHPRLEIINVRLLTAFAPDNFTRSIQDRNINNRRLMRQTLQELLWKKIQ